MKTAASASLPDGPVIVGRFLLCADDLVAAWMAKQVEAERIIPPYTAFAALDADGQIAGAVLFNQFQEASVEVSLVAPRRVSRSLLRAAASYAFDTLGVSRVTARTRASTLTVRRFIEKAGFRQEGVLRAYYRDGDDAILFGMLRTERRW